MFFWENRNRKLLHSQAVIHPLPDCHMSENSKVLMTSGFSGTIVVVGLNMIEQGDLTRLMPKVFVP